MKSTLSSSSQLMPLSTEEMNFTVNVDMSTSTNLVQSDGAENAPPPFIY